LTDLKSQTLSLFLTAKVGVNVSVGVGVGVGEAMSRKWGSVHKVLRGYLLLVVVVVVATGATANLSVSPGAKSNDE
jgi:hypothetical protein